MSVLYTQAAIIAFKITVFEWIQTHHLQTDGAFVFDPSLLKIKRALSQAPFSIIQLQSPFTSEIKYYVISPMHLGEPGGYGRMKVAYELIIDHHKCSIDFNRPVALKIIRSIVIDLPQTAFLNKTSLCYLNETSDTQFFTATLSTTSKKHYRQEHEITVPKKCYYVMPLYHGESLYEWAITYLKNSKIPLEIVWIIALKLALALQKLHQKKLVHRDVKPENIIIYLTKKDASIEYLDINLIDLDYVAREGQHLPISGSKTYMAPELKTCLEKKISTSTWMYCSQDIYSYGFTIHRLLKRAEIPPEYSKVYERLHKVIKWCEEEQPEKRLPIDSIIYSLNAINLENFKWAIPPEHPGKNPWLFEDSVLTFNITHTKAVEDSLATMTLAEPI